MAIRTPDSPRLPQPGWRLTGFASIGIGAGLLTADAPFAVLAAAFIPALISMIVIAAQAITPTWSSASRGGDPPAANWSSVAGRRYSARITAR